MHTNGQPRTQRVVCLRAPLSWASRQPWQQAGTIASAVLAPHQARGKRSKPSDFVPVANAPQHETQLQATMDEIIKRLGG
jgi:hypothetical protein